MELTGVALRLWSAYVPSTTVNQVYNQIGSVQVEPVAIDVGTMDAGALRHSTANRFRFIGRCSLGDTTFIVCEFVCLGTGFGALILILTAVSGCSWATLAEFLVRAGAWLLVRGYCELIYWLAATTSGGETCVGNVVAGLWGGDRYGLFTISLSTAFFVGVGRYWSKNALGNFVDHRSSLPTAAPA